MEKIPTRKKQDIGKAGSGEKTWAYIKTKSTSLYKTKMNDGNNWLLPIYFWNLRQSRNLWKIKNLKADFMIFELVYLICINFYRLTN